ASLYLQAAGITLTNGIRDKNAFRFGDVELPRFTGNNGGYVRTDSGGNQILINWRRGAKFPILSLQEFQTKKNDRAYWQDKVVIIGYTAPFSAKDTFFAYNTEIYGVEYHAHVVSQILSTVLDKRSPLCSIPLWLEYCLILVGGLGGMVWALRCNSPWSMYGGLAGSIMLLFSANYGLLVRHYWLPIAPTIFSTISSTIITRNVRDFRAFLQQQAELLEQRQRTLDDAFNAMHNGPLHTLGEMLSLLKMEEVPQAVIITKLQQLDRELRTVYESLRPENLARAASIPLHELLFEVYHRTMQRDFACFRSLKVKIPDIQPIDDRGLSGELKREICDFLE
ncbi:MAG: CHASE2 domain-containing protein, partial [Pseudanabaenaceae cyanobacterium]